MYNGNPHAPTTAWLESIAGPGGYEDAEVGDEDTETFPRDDGVFEVTVRKVAEDPDEWEPNAEDDDTESLPRGVYLLADTPTSATPLATEAGDGDRELLREALVEHDVTVDVGDVNAASVLDVDGEAVVAIKGTNGVTARVGVPEGMVDPFRHTVDEAAYVYDDGPHDDALIG